MIEGSDLEYFVRRAAEERELSERASDPVAADIHRELWERYEAIVAANGENRSLL